MRRGFHGFLAVVLTLLAWGCHAHPAATLRVGEHKIHVEVASTSLERETGLMFRTEIGEDDGMIFIFPDVSRKAFWMHNTYIPLTVAFVDERGVLVNEEDMEPETDTPHWSQRPVRYALEMKQGWFARHGIAPGARILGLDALPTPTDH